MSFVVVADFVVGLEGPGHGASESPKRILMPQSVCPFGDVIGAVHR